MVIWKLGIARILATFFCCWGLLSAQQSFANQALKRYFQPSSNIHGHQVLKQRLVYPLELEQFYAKQNFQPVWYPPYRLDDSQQSLIRFIGQIGEHGLQPEDYHYASLLKNCQWPFKSDLFLPCDILLSDAFLIMSQDLLLGKVDPNQLFKNTKISKQAFEPLALLEQAVGASNFEHFLRQLQPQSDQYQALKAQLALLRSQPSPIWQPLEHKPTIRLDDNDQRLLTISERLYYWGDLVEANYQLLYDHNLEQAVIRFQKRHGLKPDGVIGKETFAALSISPQQRIAQLVTNLERLRWLPQEPSKRHLLVNVAAFEMQAMDNGEVAFKKPIIVGKLKRQTPIFSHKIQYLTFNPTWTVPWKLATRDKLPLLKEDPSYIQKMGFKVFENYSDPVDPSLIDWQQLSRYNFPYQLVQAPGPKNALGQVKFMFPNPYEVYLHDTPTKNLFKKASRAFSSGCIRVFEPLDLAQWLLDSEGYNEDDIKILLYKKRTDTVYLSDTVPVHIRYWTAFTDEQQQLHFRNDIYQRDEIVYQALQTSSKRTPTQLVVR